MGRSAHDFDSYTYGRGDLRIYMKNFELPDPEIREPSANGTFILPAVDSRFTKNHQHRKLDIQHEVWRCLETVHALGPQLTSLVRPWIDRTFFPVPNLLLNWEYFARPNDPRYNLPHHMPPLYIETFTEITNVYTWVALAAVTAMRIFHYQDRNFRNMSLFSSQNANNSSGLNPVIFDYIVWKRDPNAPMPEPSKDETETETDKDSKKKKEKEIQSEPIVLAYLSPHSLTARELEELVDCGAFPVYDSMSPHNLQGKYRLWAKIWDACQVEKTQWFILTNYTHWVFGGFSKAGRAAYVSPIIPYKPTKDKKSPSVLEWMTFWMASACNRTNFTLPKIFEPITTSHDFYPSQVQNIPPAPPSISVWSDPGEAIDIDMDSILARETSPVPPHVDKDEMNAWIGVCRENFPLQQLVDEDDFQFGPEPVQLFEMNKPRGEWML